MNNPPLEVVYPLSLLLTCMYHSEPPLNISFQSFLQIHEVLLQGGIWGEYILRASRLFQYTSVGLFSWLDTTILKDNIYISEACGNYTHCYEKQEKNLKMKWTAKINKNYFQIVFEEHVILWYSINLMCNITLIYILYMQKQRLRTVNSIWEIAQLVNDKAGISTLI